VTLALPKQGQLTPACKVVSALIRETVERWGGQLNEPA
jgi:LysR family transcriptional regulator, nitrogen assimilation regulatory protein